MIDFLSRPRQIWGYIVDPNRDQIALGNIVFIVFCVCTGVLTGSLTSIYAICGIFFSVFHILRGVVPWQLDRAATATAAAFAGFFVAELLAYAALPGGDGLKEIVSNLPFLGLLPLYSLFIVDRDRLISVIERSAAGVSVVAALAAVLSHTTPEARVELSAGNPGITAVLASVLLLINMIGLFRKGPTMWSYSLLGALASIVVLLLTGMRSLWPCLIVIPLIVAIGYRSKIRLTLNLKSVVLSALVILAVAPLVSGTITERFAAVGSDLEEISRKDFSNSLGIRIMLWQAGSKMVVQQPLLGYGPGSVESKTQEATQNMGGPEVSFTHFHNMIINELIRAGLVGLTAMGLVFLVPLYFVLKADKNEFRLWALTMIVGLQTSYVLSGLTGIMFGHDILDMLFISVTALCLYLVRLRPDTIRSQHIDYTGYLLSEKN